MWCGICYRTDIWLHLLYGSERSACKVSVPKSVTKLKLAKQQNYSWKQHDQHLFGTPCLNSCKLSLLVTSGARVVSTFLHCVFFWNLHKPTSEKRKHREWTEEAKEMRLFWVPADNKMLTLSCLHCWHAQKKEVRVKTALNSHYRTNILMFFVFWFQSEINFYSIYDGRSGLKVWTLPSWVQV